MPRTCTVCRHEKRREIDRALLDGAPNRVIARQFSVGHDAVQRHKPHVSRRLAKSAEVAEVADADSLVRQLRQLTEDAARIGEKAEQAKQYSAAMGGIREMARVVELIARLTGLLDESTRVSVLVQQQQTRDTEQMLMLERLTLDERLELARLIAKAQGEGEAVEMAEIEPSIIANAVD